MFNLSSQVSHIHISTLLPYLTGIVIEFRNSKNLLNILNFSL